MTVPEFVQKLKEAQMAQMQAQARAQQQAQQGGAQPPQQAQVQPGQPQQGAPVPIQPGPPNPAALAVAAFLRKQDLKSRTCILNDQRKEMFKGKECASKGIRSHIS